MYCFVSCETKVLVCFGGHFHIPRLNVASASYWSTSHSDIVLDYVMVTLCVSYPMSTYALDLDLDLVLDVVRHVDMDTPIDLVVPRYVPYVKDVGVADIIRY